MFKRRFKRSRISVRDAVCGCPLPLCCEHMIIVVDRRRQRFTPTSTLILIYNDGYIEQLALIV